MFLLTMYPRWKPLYVRKNKGRNGNNADNNLYLPFLFGNVARLEVKMAGRMRHFGLTLVDNALKEYEDLFFRLNAMTQDNLTWNQWNIEIYKQGILVMAEAIRRTEDESKLC
jgi:hypothetical protein